MNMFLIRHSMLRFVALVGLVLGFLLPELQAGSPGSLDTSFNGNGTVITPIGTTSDTANSVAIQIDGKIVAAGKTTNGTYTNYSLARYNNNGTLDTTFNGTGKVTTALDAANDAATCVAVQTDGRIVAAGFSGVGFALVRYNTDGTLDTAFNGTGKVNTAFGTTNDIATSLAVQTDGKIVAAGYSHNGTKYNFALARYNSNGTLDATFNGTGKVTTAISTGQDYGNGLALQSDGKIVVAGVSPNGIYNSFALARYNSDGTLDIAFNGTGKVTTSIGGSSYDTGKSVAIQSDGKIVVGGYSTQSGNYSYALVRYNTDGTLDTTFNGTGKATASFGTSTAYASSVALQSDGKILIAGNSRNGSNLFTLLRFNSDGTLDATFNGTGKVTTAVGTVGDLANSMAIQTDGRIILAGSSLSTFTKFALARYEAYTPTEYFTQWTQTANLSGINSGTAATPYGDGVPNLLKYAFHMNGSGPARQTLAAATGTAGLPVLTVQGSPPSCIFRFEFLRRIGSGLVCSPVKNSTLSSGTWTALSSPPTITPIDLSWERVTYNESFDATVTPTLFGKVTVTLP